MIVHPDSPPVKPNGVAQPRHAPAPEPIPDTVETVGREPAVEVFASLWLDLYFEQSYADVARHLERLRTLGFEVKPTASVYWSNGRVD